MTVLPTSSETKWSPSEASDPAVAIDLSTALRRIGDDRSLLRDLAMFFVEDVPGLLTQLRSAIPEGAAEEVERAAHSIKGLAANLDAKLVHGWAQRLEEAGRRSELEGACGLLDQLDREATIAITFLRNEVLDASA